MKAQKCGNAPSLAYRIYEKELKGKDELESYLKRVKRIYEKELKALQASTLIIIE